MVFHILLGACISLLIFFPLDELGMELLESHQEFKFRDIMGCIFFLLVLLLNNEIKAASPYISFNKAFSEVISTPRVYIPLVADFLNCSRIRSIERIENKLYTKMMKENNKLIGDFIKHPGTSRGQQKQANDILHMIEFTEQFNWFMNFKSGNLFKCRLNNHIVVVELSAYPNKNWGERAICHIINNKTELLLNEEKKQKISVLNLSLFPDPTNKINVIYFDPRALKFSTKSGNSSHRIYRKFVWPGSDNNPRSGRDWGSFLFERSMRAENKFEMQ